MRYAFSRYAPRSCSAFDGKLFVALLSQKLIRVGIAVSPWGYYLPEEATPPESMA
jgi:hypothetical protein